jgi:hypothetical protein
MYLSRCLSDSGNLYKQFFFAYRTMLTTRCKNTRPCFKEQSCPWDVTNKQVQETSGRMDPQTQSLGTMGRLSKLKWRRYVSRHIYSKKTLFVCLFVSHTQGCISTVKCFGAMCTEQALWPINDAEFDDTDCVVWRQPCYRQEKRASGLERCRKAREVCTRSARCLKEPRHAHSTSWN